MAKRVGVNYTPSKNWWWSWQEWDADSIARDLDAIVGLGCDHARIHLMWSTFQPAAGWLAPSAFERLGQLLDMMAERHLDACIAILDGWLSGMDFTPAWMFDCAASRRRALFDDEWTVGHTTEFVTAVVKATKDHPAVFCYDIGNEPNVLAEFNPTTDLYSPQRWGQRLMDAVAALTDIPAVVGVAHPPWTEATSCFERHHVAGMWRAPIHAWPRFTGALERFGEDSLAATGLCDYLAEVAVASQRTGLEPVWIQETGSSAAWLSGSSPAEHTRALWEGIRRSPHVDMVTWWCSHDLDRRFDSFDDCEYDLGLLDLDNQVKPTGRVFAEAAARWRAEPNPAPREQAMLIRGPVADLDHLARWAEAAAEGQWLALVDEDRADDAGYLASRGITSIV